jgi:hypothetical protein
VQPPRRRQGTGFCRLPLPVRLAAEVGIEPGPGGQRGIGDPWAAARRVRHLVAIGKLIQPRFQLAYAQIIEQLRNQLALVTRQPADGGGEFLFHGRHIQ